MASRDLKIAAAVVFCFAVYTLFWTNLKDCKFSRVPQLTNLLDATQYDSVKIFLLFIGYNRSRHTLLASLLDAHPNIIVANDYNILGEWIKNPLLSQRSKYYMYELLYAKSRYDVMFGVRSRLVGDRPKQYHYNIKDQWQGRYKHNLQVVGDKKAARASKIARGPEGIKALRDLEKKLGVQLKFIHVVRNPFDNIATMTLRRAQERKKGQVNLKVNLSNVLDGSIKSYGELARGSLEVKKNFPGRVLDVASIDVMTYTTENLRNICNFLEITCTEKYLQDCAAIVDPVPSTTRTNVEWNTDQINRVRRLISQYPFLRRYSFYD
ncbi:uncharacterized protein [Pocillopora verrucosa]|uniref:uncharacterized protein isoform X1 n=2 Tax=Pocillopora verrucosa TaxID=203993 RepID=UPI0033418A09